MATGDDSSSSGLNLEGVDDVEDFVWVRWMIRSSQSKIMMGPAGLGHKVPTKLVQVKGNILESGRLVWVRTDSGLSGLDQTGYGSNRSTSKSGNFGSGKQV
ncbi:hypothetical protein HanOQP8_Chr12g0444111 [Helianthus annuus]|nr:hypothetical protein HanOQP8_Chr12g0444111 [Helianthus annuus]